ncbi:hypothetical protein [Sedimentitalea nanhaiensis]|uniref:Uncharacterized protein n=1 Tax=Sedimentitalea nanhaiensis TaxID=999627 RepID=A0A1I7D6S7_9RHOB|nr:hypothetical protein [Sedimentitalea nanhaiensis]SFU07377.1 hypothetical protein SAMN05216236_12363 [Sedimentitalea nanhaiensis]
MQIRAALIALSLPLAATAQEPLSVIEWLGEHPPPGAGHLRLEPPVSETAVQPQVDVSPLDRLPDVVGLVPADVTGLPVTLWQGSEIDDLVDLIAKVPVRGTAAMQTLLYTLLLSESAPPGGAATDEPLLLARIDRLLELGATDPALALAEQAGPTRSPALFRRWFDATLLTGTEDQSCAVLARAPHLAPDYAARIFCDARGGDWQTAALTLETAHALELLPLQKLNLLDRFLSPDIFEDAPPLPAPHDPDPLTFRLFETIGERLPTASLPRAFATADLRDIAGWKAQIEAAERLARVGALAPNQLLGLYTDRRPSASGGVWDRVQAVQQFDTALRARNAEAVTKTLPAVWRAMQEVELESPFADLFANDLAAVPLTDPTARALAWHIQLLSPAYAAAGTHLPTDTEMHVFLAALTRGSPADVPPPNATAAAITEGFSPGTGPDPVTPDGPRLGETLLRAIRDFDSGARGNPTQLSRALQAFRAAGLDDTARRASLQLMLRGRR